MARPETGPSPVLYPVLGAFLGYMFGWVIAVILYDMPFEYVQGGFGTNGLYWSATGMAGATHTWFFLASWIVAALGGYLGYRISRLP